MTENLPEERINHIHDWGGDAVTLSVLRSKGGDNAAPGFIWLGGFRSDMAGTKAQVMVDEASRMNVPSLRFDYSGHGESGGTFTDGTISRWVSESLSVFNELTEGPQILVGSSMGGWIALRMAQEFGKSGAENRLVGLLLIAPAPDFTSRLMELSFTEEEKQAMATQGYIEQSSEYSDEPNIITRALIEDGAKNSVLTQPLRIDVPVRILQGMDDPDVPWQHAMELTQALPQDDVTITMVKDGDHRLSTEANLELLRRTMRQMHSEGLARVEN